MNEITEKEQEEILKHLMHQLDEIKSSLTMKVFNSIKITCPDCQKKRSMLVMYRCFQCGLWICAKCAGKHFDIDKSKLPKYVKSRDEDRINLDNSGELK